LLPSDKDATEEERANLEKEFQARLKMYQKQTPYVDPEAKAEGDGAPLPQDTILQEEGVPGGEKPSNKRKKKPKGTVVDASEAPELVTVQLR
jgi:hypothetical protein